MDNKKILRIGGIVAVILIGLFAFTVIGDDSRGFNEVDTSIAIEQLDKKNIKEAQIDDREQRIRLTLKDGINVDGKGNDLTKIKTEYPARSAPTIFDKVTASAPEKYTTKVNKDNFLTSMLGMLLPMLILFGLIMFFFSRMQGGGMGMFGFGGSRAKELTKDMPTNTFADVAGADEAVDELQEIKDFLQDPARYEALGAKIPRGVLLYGPPGTGKTLLARAVAGEAGVPFFSISGSDFVEMFVGVGASRVRDLFKQAKENSPCIIFVDEIDAVGRQRGSGMGGGHDEREQTLNQLLVEMDGFGDRQGVILMAATNRPDILDPALLRPGRFDRQIPVSNPDLKGREEILKVHAKGKPFAPDADLVALAKRTAGMSGADLENVLNEAALLTARIDGNVITGDALEEATDRVVGGPRRSSKIISEHEKKVTAYHEGGHTLAAWAMKDIERVYKVTILARGRTGGHAMTAPEDDKGMYNRSELFARLVFAMGGRSAEELVFGQPTTGASNDIEQATKIARAMITEYGMSPELGTVKYGEEQGDPFVGRGATSSLDYSPAVAATIDEQVRYLVNKAHEQAYDILREHRDILDRLAEKLLEKETLRRPDLEVLFKGIVPRDPIPVFPGEETYFPSQEGRVPVKTPTELAIERGEEPPKRFSILEASRAARAKREAERAAERERSMQPVPAYVGTGNADVAPHSNPAPGSTPSSAPTNEQPQQAPPTSPGYNSPTYGGTPPPSGWTVPGWPAVQGKDQVGRDGAQHQQQQNPTSDTGAHPGWNTYGGGAPQTAPSNPMQDGTTPTTPHGNAQRGPAHSAEQLSKRPSDSPTEIIGFRLPEHEQPEHQEQSYNADPNKPESKGPEQGHNG